MDTFLSCATLMLKELRALLQITPIAFTWQRLVQMMALNMFTVHHTQAPNGEYRPCLFAERLFSKFEINQILWFSRAEIANICKVLPHLELHHLSFIVYKLQLSGNISLYATRNTYYPPITGVSFCLGWDRNVGH